MSKETFDEISNKDKMERIDEILLTHKITFANNEFREEYEKTEEKLKSIDNKIARYLESTLAYFVKSNYVASLLKADLNTDFSDKLTVSDDSITDSLTEIDVILNEYN